MVKKIMIACFSVIAFIGVSKAQEDCKVLMPEISGTYKGDCKNGKANGKGESRGKDVYSGQFKNGLPDGEGNYFYSNGDFFNGNWDNGKKTGYGTFTYKRTNKSDSVVTGFWKKDKYIGRYEFVTHIFSKSTQFTTVFIKKGSGSIKNTITINLSNTSGNARNLNSRPFITNMIILKGEVQAMQDQNTGGPKSSSKILINVRFPFRAKVFSGTQMMEFEITEAGQWIIDANLNN